MEPAIIRRLVLLASSALLALAACHFLYHDVRVTESFIRGIFS